MPEKTLTRRSLIVRGAAGAATLAATGCTQAAPSEAAAPVKLAIIHTNDTHGHDLLDEESLGLAAVVQLKREYEEQGYEVLLLDAGDAVQGTNLVNRSQGDAAIEFMNRCGYAAMALGNHEFDFGQDKIADFRSAAEFPLLSANITVNATGELLAEAHTVFTLSDGTRVGVFGLTTPETITSANPLLTQGLTFLEGEELYACAQAQADALRADGCSLVVCLAHLGEEEALTGNRAMDVAAHTAGIDLFIDGHDHAEECQLIANAEGADTLVVETGCFTHAVGVVTWEEELAEELVAFGSYEGQDAEVAAYIQDCADEVDAQLSEPVATSAFMLDGERDPGVRTHETNLGDLVADAVFWEADRMADDTPDCAIVNGGGIRQSLPPGEITTGDVLNVLPFLNYVCTVQVTGAQLLEALEASCAVTPEQVGAFPQVASISFTVDTRMPYEQGAQYPNSTYYAPANPGSRVTIHDVGGRGFALEDTYTIASIDFLCAGGDTYYVFAEAAQTTMRSINYLLGDCLIYYLQEACGGEVPEHYADPAGQGRIEIVQ